MKKKTIINSILVIGIFALTLFFYNWFITTPYFLTFDSWVKQHLILYFILLTTIKTISIVWPPLPGGVFTIASIPVLGWFPAYLTDFLGSMLGSSIAFWLGKRYGYTLLHKLFEREEINKLKQIQVKKRKEFEVIFISRLTLGHSLLELVCYGAGLIGVSYKNFLLASIAVHTLTLIPTFYLIDGVLTHQNIWGVIGSSAIGLGVVYFLRKRYFEKKTV